ncbi:MBL fold metallo-hydrolase [Gemmatimonas groenlandica]|uniref:MBL fold metallo-hydrolase n=1 Tax=Gemmatimonas groenlandica TaxID=2732249 RepID=A0A6M4ILJ0_9BACT|nr:MBL fold metallo-hydrolase [Gemmatimonas groenlandica]QJR34266.1 MBL fold metallo-hydrolase [Gemmatimonas groenlandica]
MLEIADDVFQISVFPRNAVNAYLIGAIIVDAGVRSSAAQLKKALGKRALTSHMLTHAHADHQGSSAFLCDQYRLPLWCGAPDEYAAQTGQVTGEYPNPRHPIARLQQRLWAGPGHPVTRTLREGDMVGDFRVLETPGHASGHLALWRERDGVLIAGDVLVNMDMFTTRPGLHEPPAMFTHDVAQNRQSIHKIAALNPRVIGFGHGPVLRDSDQLLELASRFGK